MPMTSVRARAAAGAAASALAVASLLGAATPASAVEVVPGPSGSYQPVPPREPTFGCQVYDRVTGSYYCGYFLSVESCQEFLTEGTLQPGLREECRLESNGAYLYYLIAG